MGNNLFISAPVRWSVTALADAQAQQRAVQDHIATGKAILSPLDDSSRFFTAASLDDRAASLSNLLDDIGQSVQTLTAADNGLTAISKLVDVAKGKITAARSESDPSRRSVLAGEYNGLLRQIEGLAKDAVYKGKSLLAGDGNDLSTTFDDNTLATFTVKAVDYTDAAAPGGLGLADATNGWATTADLDAAQAGVNQATATIKADANTFATAKSMILNRQSFARTILTTLKNGSENLTRADMNEEGARLLALQTRQSLSTSALSLANGAAKDVLRLFGA